MLHKLEITVTKCKQWTANNNSTVHSTSTRFSYHKLSAIFSFTKY